MEYRPQKVVHNDSSGYEALLKKAKLTMKPKTKCYQKLILAAAGKLTPYTS